MHLLNIIITYFIVIISIVSCLCNPSNYYKEYTTIITTQEEQLIAMIDQIEKSDMTVNEKILEIPWEFDYAPYHQVKKKLQNLRSKYNRYPVGKCLFQNIETLNKAKQLIYMNSDYSKAISLYGEYIENMANLYMEIYPENFFCVEDWNVTFSAYSHYLFLNFLQGNITLNESALIIKNFKTGEIEDFCLFPFKETSIEQRLLNKKEFIEELEYKGFKDFSIFLHKEFNNFAYIIITHAKLYHGFYTSDDLKNVTKYLEVNPNNRAALFTYALMLTSDPFNGLMINRDYNLWRKGKIIMNGLNITLKKTHPDNEALKTMTKKTKQYDAYPQL